MVILIQIFVIDSGRHPAVGWPGHWPASNQAKWPFSQKD